MGRHTRGWLLGAIVCATWPAAAHGATLIVDTTADDVTKAACTPAANDCSLRGAVSLANTVADSDTVRLQEGATYVLTGAAGEDANLTGDLDALSGPLSIQMRGATIDAAGGDRILHAADGVNLTVFDGVLRNGSTTGNGGAVLAGTGNVSIFFLRLNNNHADGTGGAVRASGQAFLSALTVDGNTADGGGAVDLSGTGTVADSSFTASQGDSALRISGGTTNVTDSTFSGNPSGGVRTSDAAATANLRFTTIANNTAAGLIEAAGAIKISDSIVASNGAGDNCTGTAVEVADVGKDNVLFPLVADAQCPSPAFVAGDPKLLPLTDNGGGTPTHRLGPGSVARAQSQCSLFLDEDQRGAKRAQPNCDTGALETQQTDLSLAIRPDVSPATTGRTFVLMVSAANAGPGTAYLPVVTLVLPSGLEYIGPADDRDCSLTSSTVRCVLDGISAIPTEFGIVVRASAAGQVVVNGSIAALEEDPDGQNNLGAGTAAVEAFPPGPDWLLPATVVSGAPLTGLLDLASSPDGATTSVWNGDEGIYVSDRLAGSRTFGAGTLVPGTSPGDTQVRIARGGGGRAALIWYRPGVASGLYAAVRTSSGSWSAPELLAADVAQFQPYWGVTITPDGTVVVAYIHGTTQLAAATRAPSAGAWTTEPIPGLGAPGGRLFAGVPIDAEPDGDVVIAWLEDDGGSDKLVASRRAAATGTWSATPETVGAKPVSDDFDLVADASGGVHALWLLAGTGTPSTLTSNRGTNGVWSSPQALETGPRPFGADLAAGPDGHLAAVWSQGAAGADDQAIRVAIRSPGGTWGTAQELTTHVDLNSNGAPVWVAIGPGGVAAAVWSHHVGGNDGVQGATRAAGSTTWGRPEDLSVLPGDAFFPRLDFDAEGNAQTVWGRRDSGGTARLETSVLDAAPPRVTALTVPATGLAGTSLRMSIAAADTWSAVGEPRWTFGDGTSATGSTVDHAYAAPGPYTVTADIADALGNAAGRRSATVTVAAAPVVAPVVAPPPAPDGPATPAADRDGPRIAIAPARVRMTRTGVLVLRLTCPAKESRCEARTTLRTVRRLRVGRAPARTLPMGTRSVTIRGGRTVTIRVKVPAKGRSALRRARSLRVKVTVAGRDRAGNRRTSTRTVTVLRPRA